MRKAAIILAVVLDATPVFAGDHLVPEESIFGYAASPDNAQLSYDHAMVIAEVFKDAFADDVVLREIDWNPLAVESAVGLKQENGEFHIFWLQSGVSLFRYAEINAAKRGDVDKDGKRVIDERLVADYQAEVPADPKDVKVRRCEAGIDPALGARIVDVWDAMLRRSGYNSPEEDKEDQKALEAKETRNPDGTMSVQITTDGTWAHFYRHQMGSPLMEGMIYEPDEVGPKTAALSHISYGMGSYCREKSASSLAELTKDVATLEQLLNSEKPK